MYVTSSSICFDAGSVDVVFAKIDNHYRLRKLYAYEASIDPDEELSRVCVCINICALIT